MPIPSLNQNGELPQGDHVATMAEVETAFWFKLGIGTSASSIDSMT